MKNKINIYNFKLKDKNNCKVYLDERYVKAIANSLISDITNIANHYEDITYNDFNKIDKRELVNIKEKKKYIKVNSKEGKHWILCNVYSFDILTQDAKQLYDIINRIIQGESEAFYEGLRIYKEKCREIECLEDELFNELNLLDTHENDIGKMKNLKTSITKIKNYKENSIYKYYEMLYDITDNIVVKQKKKLKSK